MTPKLKFKESDIENEILAFLNGLKEGFFWKNPAGGFFDGKAMRRHNSRFILKGASDVFGLYKGEFYAFEIKTPISIKFYELHKERLSVTAGWALKNDKEKHFRRQILFQRKIKAFGGNAFFVSSVADVKKILEIE